MAKIILKVLAFAALWGALLIGGGLAGVWLSGVLNAVTEAPSAPEPPIAVYVVPMPDDTSVDCVLTNVGLSCDWERRS